MPKIAKQIRESVRFRETGGGARRDGIAGACRGRCLRTSGEACRGDVTNPPGLWQTEFLRTREVTDVSTAPAEVQRPDTAQETARDLPWVTIVWNDPVNLMSYVTYVFQTVFGYAKPKAEKLMLDVHHKGRAVVSSGAREAMERDAETLHGFGLWATISHDS
jgi:ATP-dependent Clp protease adaptor protein ClpS